MNKYIEMWTEISRQDNCFDHMVPSDVRGLLYEISRLESKVKSAENIIKAAKEIKSWIDLDQDHNLIVCNESLSTLVQSVTEYENNT